MSSFAPIEIAGDRHPRHHCVALSLDKFTPDLFYANIPLHALAYPESYVEAPTAVNADGLLHRLRVLFTREGCSTLGFTVFEQPSADHVEVPTDVASHSDIPFKGQIVLYLTSSV